jgi:hypothetical protein
MPRCPDFERSAGRNLPRQRREPGPLRVPPGATYPGYAGSPARAYVYVSPAHESLGEMGWL